jgi:hypothetical protein
VADEHLPETSPDFRDGCNFEEFTGTPTWGSGAIHHGVRYATRSDLFANSSDDAVRLAAHRGLTHVLVAGMRCNLWMPSFFEKLRRSGIRPLWVADLSDVAFYRRAQVGRFTTHTEATAHFANWLSEAGFATVSHWQLLNQADAGQNRVVYDGNLNAFNFDWY